MCSSDSGSYESKPVPSIIPGATDVSSGKTSEGELALNKMLEARRKKKGVSSTIRSDSSRVMSDDVGKKLLGE